MKVLVIGAGGREHAIAWKLAQSPRITEVLVAPGNPGTAREPKLRNLAPSAVADLVELAQREQVGFTVVGPEAPLAAGVVDAFRAARLPIFGPTRAAARIETDKAWARALLTRHGITCLGNVVRMLDFECDARIGGIVSIGIAFEGRGRPAPIDSCHNDFLKSCVFRSGGNCR